MAWEGFLMTAVRSSKWEGEIEKGCDFGYAPTGNSCEGAGGVDACTVTAFDVISAFTLPNPG